MKKLWDWLNSSNRLKHFGLGMVVGLGADDWYCAAYTGAGVAGALEFKDWQWGGKPDVIDFLFTVAGVLLGYLIKSLVLG